MPPATSAIPGTTTASIEHQKQQVDSFFLSTANSLAELHGCRINWDKTDFENRILSIDGPSDKAAALAMAMEDALGEFAI